MGYRRSWGSYNDIKTGQIGTVMYKTKQTEHDHKSQQHLPQSTSTRRAKLTSQKGSEEATAF